MRQYCDLFRSRYGIPIDVPLLITVGRADSKKRVDLLIRALSFTPDLYLLIVGPEMCELTRSWKGLAEELNVSDRIIWTGHLAGEELLSAYGAADIFSLISNDENFGMAVVEAMGCGLLILINPEVGVSEVVKLANGVMLVEKNPEAIAKALQGFLNQRERWDAWRKNNLQVAHEHFAKDKVATIMAQAFGDLLTSRKDD